MIHIIGANGYIGKKICNYFERNKVAFDCYSDIEDEQCKKLDLRFFGEKDIELKKDDVIVLLAAISSPDVCQNNYDFAYSINVVGTSRFIDFCFKKECNVIFFSSDTVNGPTGDIANNEYSEVNPYGNYAKMKYEIEKKYMNSPRFKTIRLSYVVSPEDKFCQYLSACVKDKKPAEVFEGLYRNAIEINTVLETVYCLCLNFNFNNYYLINVSGNQCLSRKDLAEWYKIHIDSNLCYNVIPVPEAILNGRPNIIKTKSIFLEKLLGHKLNNLV